MSSKKRKAPQLQGGPKQKKRSLSLTPEFASESEHSNPPIDFDISCPAKPSLPEKDETDNVFRSVDNPGVEDLTIEYTVQPGKQWKSMQSYKSVQVKDTLWHRGQTVYVNRREPPPTPPPDDAPDSELLEFDRANLWVGKIMQAKANDPSNVFVRVFWLFWPEQLPSGRQPYHGERELVMSNEMDIIDATSIACTAEVSYWDEDDDEQDGRQKERFWRQTFDLQKYKRGSKDKGLSKLREHCICGRAYNPDKTMYKCEQPGCETWNHEECLLEQVFKTAYDHFQKGDLEEEMAKHTMKPEITARNTNTIPQLVNGTNGNHKKKKTKPWEGKIAARVHSTDSANGTGSVLATVRLLVDDKKSSNKAPNQWTIKLDCLECGQPLD